MWTGKRAAVIILLACVTGASVFFGLWRSGLILGKPVPPARIGKTPVEMIDVATLERMTKTFDEWQRLGQKWGAYKNPKTGEYTMLRTMVCPSCGEVIPEPNTDLYPRDVAAQMDQRLRFRKCPKCGANLFPSLGPGP